MVIKLRRGLAAKFLKSPRDCVQSHGKSLAFLKVTQEKKKIIITKLH